MTPDERNAIKTVLRGFDEGVFIRDISLDAKPGWAIKLLPYMQALAVLVKATEEPR